MNNKTKTILTYDNLLKFTKRILHKYYDHHLSHCLDTIVANFNACISPNILSTSSSNKLRSNILLGFFMPQSQNLDRSLSVLSKTSLTSSSLLLNYCNITNYYFFRVPSMFRFTCAIYYKDLSEDILYCFRISQFLQKFPQADLVSSFYF